LLFTLPNRNYVQLHTSHPMPISYFLVYIINSFIHIPLCYTSFYLFYHFTLWYILRFILHFASLTSISLYDIYFCCVHTHIRIRFHSSIFNLKCVIDNKNTKHLYCFPDVCNTLHSHVFFLLCIVQNTRSSLQLDQPEQ